MILELRIKVLQAKLTRQEAAHASLTDRRATKSKIVKLMNKRKTQ